MAVNFDTSELESLIIDIHGLPAAVEPRVSQALAISARKIAGTAKRHGRSMWFPTVSRGVEHRAGHLEAEVETASPWGVIKEFGAASKPPTPFMRPALRENMPDIQRGIEKAVTQTMRERL